MSIWPNWRSRSPMRQHLLDQDLIGVRSRKSLTRSFLGLAGLFFAVARRRRRRQRLDQTVGGSGHFVDRAVEDGFVRARRTIRSAQLPHELQSRGPDLVRGRRRRKISKGLDVSTHASSSLSQFYTERDAPIRPGLTGARNRRRGRASSRFFPSRDANERWRER